jgi:hypothetical protein
MWLFVYIPQGLWRLIVLHQYVILFKPASNRAKTAPNRLKTALERAFLWLSALAKPGIFPYPDCAEISDPQGGAP